MLLYNHPPTDTQATVSILATLMLWAVIELVARLRKR